MVKTVIKVVKLIIMTVRCIKNLVTKIILIDLNADMCTKLSSTADGLNVENR